MAKANKEEQRKAPILRFKGFTDDWEQRQLGEVETVNPSSLKLPDYFFYIDLESVQSGILVKENLIEKEDAPSRAQRILKKNDILFQSVRPYQKNNYIVTDDKNSVASTGYIQLRSKNHNQRFIFYFLHNDNFVHSVLQRCTGTTYPAISPKDFSTINVFLSNDKLEEKQIGNFFKILDNLITLYERKIKLFDDMIAYLKQQLFYKQTSLSFPQSHWKDIAFSKLYVKRKDKNIDVSYDQSKTISVANMKYSDRELNSSREYLKTYYITHFGDIIYEGNRSGNFKYGRFVQNDIGDGIVSHVFTVYKPINDLDMNFMNNFINYEPIMSRVLLYATTDTLMMHTLHDNELLKQKLSLPDKEAQIKIGRILNLVSTIKNKFSERKELLIKIKNTLLNTMFI